MTRIDDAVFVKAGEHLRMVRRSSWLQGIIAPVKGYRGHGYQRILSQAGFEFLQCGFAGLKAEGVPIAADHDVHEVRIFERVG